MRPIFAARRVRLIFLMLAVLTALVGGGIGRGETEPSGESAGDQAPATKTPELKDFEVAAAAPSGAFTIRQLFVEVESIEVVEFKARSGKPVELARYDWAGHYSISPDERWILRLQKIGSGSNIGILYAVEPNGRLMEVVGFNALLWDAWDEVSPLKRSDLFHTFIRNAVWSKDGKSLELNLVGTEIGGMGNGVDVRMVYHPGSHKVTVVPPKHQ
jgi:hypothetical protein